MDPIYRLPPWRIESILSASDLTQVIDWGLIAGGVPAAWQLSRGEGVTVAVLDTGVDREHADLVTQFASDPADFTGSPWGPDDRQGHGTHCAGIIAATDNAQGVVGVAPMAKLLVGKVLGDDGSGLGDWVAAGIDWARANKADVISMSLGSPAPDPRIKAAIGRAVAAGVFVVTAAGNSGPHNADIDYPGRFDGTLAIASINRDGNLSSFSSRGPQVDFAAPGEQILSTFPGGRYARLSGTSMATPFVAGIVALLISAHKKVGDQAMTPLKTHEQLVEHLRRYARDAGPAGPDQGFGFGIISVDKLVEAEQPPPPPPDDRKTLQLGPVTLHMPAAAGDRIGATWPAALTDNDAAGGVIRALSEAMTQ